MQVITEVYNVFSFNELSKEAKQKALDNLRDINTDTDTWNEWVIEDKTIELEKMGYTDAKIYFSGFWSQGDGASFTCTVDLTKWIKSHDKKFIKKYASVLKIADDCSISITKSYQYEHSNTMSIDFQYYSENDALNKKINELEELIINDAKSEADKIYRLLEKSYETDQSDEAVQETIEANEYTFLENGTMKNS